MFYKIFTELKTKLSAVGKDLKVLRVSWNEVVEQQAKFWLSLDQSQLKFQSPSRLTLRQEASNTNLETKTNPE